jgi:hypothetical protein
MKEKGMEEEIIYIMMAQNTLVSGIMIGLTVKVQVGIQMATS